MLVFNIYGHYSVWYQFKGLLRSFSDHLALVAPFTRLNAFRGRPPKPVEAVKLSL